MVLLPRKTWSTIVLLSTLNSNLKKLQTEIEQIDLDKEVIRASGSRATCLYRYSLEDVGKLVLNMDSVILVL